MHHVIDSARTQQQRRIRSQVRNSHAYSFFNLLTGRNCSTRSSRRRRNTENGDSTDRDAVDVSSPGAERGSILSAGGGHSSD